MKFTKIALIVWVLLILVSILAKPIFDTSNPYDFSENFAPAMDQLFESKSQLGEPTANALHNDIAGCLLVNASNKTFPSSIDRMLFHWDILDEEDVLSMAEAQYDTVGSCLMGSSNSTREAELRLRYIGFADNNIDNKNINSGINALILVELKKSKSLLEVLQTAKFAAKMGFAFEYDELIELSRDLKLRDATTLEERENAEQIFTQMNETFVKEFGEPQESDAPDTTL